MSVDKSFKPSRFVKYRRPSKLVKASRVGDSGGAEARAKRFLCTGDLFSNGLASLAYALDVARKCAGDAAFLPSDVRDLPFTLEQRQKVRNAWVVARGEGMPLVRVKAKLPDHLIREEAMQVERALRETGRYVAPTLPSSQVVAPGAKEFKYDGPK